MTVLMINFNGQWVGHDNREMKDTEIWAVSWEYLTQTLCKQQSLLWQDGFYLEYMLRNTDYPSTPHLSGTAVCNISTLEGWAFYKDRVKSRKLKKLIREDVGLA